MPCAGQWVAGLGGALVIVPAALGAPAAIETLKLSSAGDQTSLVVSLSDFSSYRMFTLAAPDRVVVDISSARLAPSVLPLPSGTGAIRQVRVANRPDGSVRVVLELAAHVEPKSDMYPASDSSGNRLVVDLFKAPIGNLPPQPLPADIQGAGSGNLAATPAGRATGTDGHSDPATPDTQGTSIRADQQRIGRDIVIAVDAGHGGKDPGAHGPRGVLEKDVTLRIARRLVDTINAEPGMRGVLTRNRDEFIPLRGRMERARKAQADLFVSIHADAVRNRTVQGASIYVLNEKGATDEAAKRLAARENAADLIGGVSLGDKDPMLRSVLLDLSQNASLSSSIEVADEILDEMARVGTVRRRQVMQAPFMVLEIARCPVRADRDGIHLQSAGRAAPRQPRVPRASRRRNLCRGARLLLQEPATRNTGGRDEPGASSGHRATRDSARRNLVGDC